MTIRVCFVFAVFGLVVFSAGRAGAEPRFLSKRYNRCSSCHYSASGGGLLTPYGRALSGQELATTRHVNAQPAPEGNVSGEDAFLFGALGDHLGPVQLGVSLLPSHLHFASGSFSDSRNLLMNADVEGAYRGHGWTAYGEAGRMPGDRERGPPTLFARTLGVLREHARRRDQSRTLHAGIRHPLRRSHIAQPKRSRVRP